MIETATTSRQSAYNGWFVFRPRFCGVNITDITLDKNSLRFLNRCGSPAEPASLLAVSL
jgi:hypothetical protein